MTMVMESNLPTIMAGGPVATGRAWCIPEWLSALLHQEYPPEKVRIAIFVNDGGPLDETVEIIKFFQRQFPYRCITFYESRLGGVRDNNDRFNTVISDRRGKYERFAWARNRFADMLENEVYLWSVDCDVVCPPDILRRLVAHRLPLVAAKVVNNCWAPVYHMNALKWLNPSRGPDGSFWWDPELWEEGAGLHEVDVTGACFLIHRKVIDAGVRWEPHPNGEDAPFCWRAQQMGHRLFIDLDARTDHRMKPVEYDGRFLPGHIRTMKKYWAWREEHYGREEEKSA